MRKYHYLIILILVAVFSLAFKNLEKGEKGSSISLNYQGLPSQTLLNINNMSAWHYSDGRAANNPYTGNSGVIFPRLTAGVIYQEGIVWGGQVNDNQSPQLRVNGSTYLTGLVPGAILGISTGQVENPNDPDVRIWRVRPDWQTADLTLEAIEFGMTVQEIRNQYQTDWNEWPASKGAPFDDINGNGVYDPTVDIPGIPDASQTIWYTANDINGQQIYNSIPIGIEMQVTLWGYLRTEHDPFGDITFKRVRLIYKGTATTPSNATINDMYISQWSDPDVGTYTNDFVGCDSALSLGYAYNSSPIDNNFQSYGLNPPAIGYVLIEGPIIPSPGDTAIFDFHKRIGYKNLPMTSFFGLMAADYDPDLYSYDGTLQWYNLMLGLRPRPEYPNGTPWIDPLTSTPTVFPLAGDPVEGTGWIDGIVTGPGDRRMGFSSGPFSMSLGDTQEVVIGFAGEIESTGPLAYLKNINGLKRKTENTMKFLRNNLAVDIVGNSLIRLNEFSGFSSAYLLFDHSQTIASYQWAIESAPAGSNAQLSSTNSDSTSLFPDVEGEYRLSLTLTTSGGNSATGYIDVFGTSNQPPIANFTLTPDSIILGDSLFTDASSSYDPEGDSLIYYWDFIVPVGGQGIGGFVIPTYLENGKKAYFKPTATGNYEAVLTVSDQIFEDDTSRGFHVKPKLENLSLNYSFMDTSWYRNLTYYFYQDKLLIPIQPQDIVRVYNLGTNDISFFTDLNIPNTVKVYSIQNDLLFTGQQGFQSGFWGPGSLSVYQLSPNWQVTPVLENYLPGTWDIFSVSFIDNYVLIRDNFSLYNIDFQTNPSSPQILAQRDYISVPATPFSPQASGQYLYVGVSGGQRVIEVLDKNSLNYVATLNMPQDWRTFNIIDSLMFVGFYDSLQIYSISQPLQPVKLSSIIAPRPFNWMDPYNFRIRYSGRYLENNPDNLLALEGDIGVIFYNIDDPVNPVFKGAFYNSRYMSSQYYNGAYFIFGIDVLGYSKDVYFGFNKVELISTSIPNVDFTNLSQHYALYQNYPNPFNPVTYVRFSLPEASDVKIKIYNVLGQEVAVLFDKRKLVGTHEVEFDGNAFGSGVYFYKIQAGSFQQVRKMLLVK